MWIEWIYLHIMFSVMKGGLPSGKNTRKETDWIKEGYRTFISMLIIFVLKYMLWLYVLSKFIEFWLFLTCFSCMFMSANISIGVGLSLSLSNPLSKQSFPPFQIYFVRRQLNISGIWPQSPLLTQESEVQKGNWEKRTTMWICRICLVCEYLVYAHGDIIVPFPKQRKGRYSKKRPW